MNKGKQKQTPPGDDTTEPVEDEILNGGPRATQLREMREVLQARLRDAREARDAVSPDDPRRAALERKVSELRDQVRVLAEEEAVSQFVEDSVRATVSRPRRPGTTDDNEFDIEGY